MASIGLSRSKQWQMLCLTDVVHFDSERVSRTCTRLDQHSPCRTALLLRVVNVLLVCSGAFGMACSSLPAQRVTHPSKVSHFDEPGTTEAAVDVNSKRPARHLFTSPTTDREDLARARAAFDAGKFSEAAKRYDETARSSRDAATTTRALYGAGLAHEQAGDRLTAAQRFETLAADYPADPKAQECRVRALRLWVFRGQLQRARRLASLALESEPTLGAQEQVAARSAWALAALDSGDIETATAQITLGRRVLDATPLDRLEVIPRDVAQLYFALGELRRLRAREIRFDPFPPDFAQHFERRAQGLLDAQSAYLDTMRARDAHWSAMSGYRIGQLYAELHQDVMETPTPPGLERSDAFHGAFRLRYLILLEKGLDMFERTISLAERTGQDSIWVGRAREQSVELRRLLGDQHAFIDSLPYSREDLRRVLEGIQARQRAAEGAHPSAPGDH